MRYLKTGTTRDNHVKITKKKLQKLISEVTASLLESSISFSDLKRKYVEEASDLHAYIMRSKHRVLRSRSERLMTKAMNAAYKKGIQDADRTKG